jgi:hypothetical protein
MSGKLANIEIGLNAAILSVRDGQPHILVTREGKEWDALPYGPFTPIDHRTLDIGLRKWVRARTGLELGYVEQLYTFGDRGRHVKYDDTDQHIVSVGYLALITEDPLEPLEGTSLARWYGYLPWEDWRNGKPEILTREIEPRLKRWAAKSDQDDNRVSVLTRPERLRICFAMDEDSVWDEEKVLERFELLYEAGLAAEAKRDGRSSVDQWDDLPQLGRPMQFDHRRVLATAMSRLRGKLKYRPVIFELLPESFTLFELQKIAEAILGHHVHKQNFRRLVENAGLVEPTGDVSTQTGGRPAKLFRFRRDVLLERPSIGVKMKGGKT